MHQTRLFIRQPSLKVSAGGNNPGKWGYLHRTEIQCDVLLFDLDGVLIDSTPAVARVWTRWAIERGFDPEATVHRAHGRPSLSTVRELLPDANHEEENREVERREIEDLEGVIPLPGAVGLLAALPRDRWTIVTSCTRMLAEARLRAAGLPAPIRFITASDVQNGKPHPEPFLKAASVLGVDPRNSIIVEDAPAGIRAGKAAAGRVIAFPTTAPPAELHSAGANWVVANCAAIQYIRLQDASPRMILTLRELEKGTDQKS